MKRAGTQRTQTIRGAKNVKEYERTKTISASAEETFAWLSDVGNLSHYLPPVREANIEGPSAEGKPGRRIRMRVEIPDRYETEAEGYFHVDDEAGRMEWGAEMGRDYSGWLTVQENGADESTVTVHLSFGPRSVEEQVQEESDGQRDPMEEGVEATLESIRRQIEEGSGKLDPSSPED